MSDTSGFMIPPNSGTLELHVHLSSKVFYLNPVCIERFWLSDSQDFTQLKLQGDAIPLKVTETPDVIIQMIIDARAG